MWKTPRDLGGLTKSNDATESVIGPSVHLEGNFNSSGNVVIGGSLSGSMTTSGDVRVLEGAKVQATLSATHVHVAGEVRGDIRASELLELSQTARIFGNIEAKVLSVAPGAVLHGKCAMKEGKAVPEKSETKTSRQAPHQNLRVGTGQTIAKIMGVIEE